MAEDRIPTHDQRHPVVDDGPIDLAALGVRTFRIPVTRNGRNDMTDAELDELDEFARLSGSPDGLKLAARLRLDAERSRRTQASGAALHSPADWAARQLEPPDFLMGELFSTTSRVLIAADTGLGKSMIGLGLAFAMHLGRDFLRWKARRPADRPVRVLVLDGEMPSDLLKDRIALACDWFGVEPPTDGLFILSVEDVEDMPPLDSEEGRDWLFAKIEEFGGVDFVVFDNVSCLVAGDLREESTWKPLVPLVRELSRRKVGQLWLHHVGHDKTRVYGSRTFLWQMDAVALGTAVARDGADVSLKLEWQKARRRTPTNRADFETVHVLLEGGTWSGTGDMSPGVPGGRGRPVALNGSGRNVLAALAAAMAACGERPPAHEATRGVDDAVKVTTWRRYFTQMGGYEQDDRGKEAEKKAWTRGRENAKAADRVFIWGEWAWPL
jgi:hypothetical protein